MEHRSSALVILFVLLIANLAVAAESKEAKIKRALTAAPPSVASGAKVVVLDIPLLFETGGENRVDAVVVVSAPPEMQRARVLERGLSAERLEALLARQVPDQEKRRRADFVVDSSQGIEHARAQVHAILAAVAKMPKKRR